MTIKDQIYPIILSGGSGTRLWPLSRKTYPKQFSKLIGDQTLFQLTCSRLHGDNFEAPTIVTNDRFRFTVLDELSEIDVEARQIILEPVGRNTAPAVFAGVHDIAQNDPDALVLVLPSDHSIHDVETFRKAIQIAADEVYDDQIVTFGIKPSHAETGYGYLEIDNDGYELNVLYPLSKFVEKPQSAQAEDMIAAGNFLWNAGIFMAKASQLVALYKTHQPAITNTVGAAMEASTIDLGFTRPNTTEWKKSPDISIDYGIMESADNLVVIPLDMGWSDLGDWKAVWSASSQDDAGVSTSGDAFSIDCKNSLLRSEKDDLAIVGIGLESIFAVAMGDALVVGSMDRAQDAKRAVTLLKEKGLKQADEFPRDHRPWGWFETLAQGDRFQVKRIVVKAGASLSLQSHNHRSEHWTVVEGSAKVTVDGEVKMVGENMSVYIPLGAVHRMENPGKIPLTLIEVQSGPYLGEDDIIRYEDQFGRG